MDFEETMVEDYGDEEVEISEELSEEVAEESEEDGDELESQETAEEQPEEPKGTTEPGYVQKRISKAVQKAVAETEARMQAMFEQQMAPIRAKMMEDEAQELVRTHKVADIETARELVSLRQGMPVPTAEEEQPREPNVTPKNDPATMARIDMLKHQRQRIIDSGGPDPVEAFNSDEDIKNAVIDGEMDFYDVAQQMKQTPRKRPPSPMRSPNGASGTNTNAIESMSSEQFARLEKRISEGARYRLK